MTMISNQGIARTIALTPAALPAVVGTAEIDEQIIHRTVDQVHVCFRCGGRARVAQVVQTLAGKRWLDLCNRHQVEFVDYLQSLPSPDKP